MIVDRVWYRKRCGSLLGQQDVGKLPCSSLQLVQAAFTGWWGGDWLLSMVVFANPALAGRGYRRVQNDVTRSQWREQRMKEAVKCQSHLG